MGRQKKTVGMSSRSSVGRGARLPNDLAIAPETLVASRPISVARPKDAPSRGRALDPGSARFQVYQGRLSQIISGSGSVVGSVGSLAPLGRAGAHPYRYSTRTR